MGLNHVYNWPDSMCTWPESRPCFPMSIFNIIVLQRPIDGWSSKNVTNDDGFQFGVRHNESNGVN